MSRLPPVALIHLVGTVPHGMHHQWLGEYYPDGHHEDRPVFSLRTPSWQVQDMPRGALDMRPDAALHYFAPTAQWILGQRESIGTNQGWVAVYDNASHPQDITGLWHVNAARWLPAPELRIATGDEGAALTAEHERLLLRKAAAAPNRIRLQGSLPPEVTTVDPGMAEMLGDFDKLSGTLCERRPVYAATKLSGVHPAAGVVGSSNERMYLRYSAEAGQWLMGAEVHLGTTLGYFMASNAMAWSPIELSDTGNRKRNGLGQKEERARMVGQWQAMTQSGDWIVAPDLAVVNVDVEVRTAQRYSIALMTITCVLAVPATAAFLRWGRRVIAEKLAHQAAVARAEKLREKRAQRKAMDAEVRKFEALLGGRSLGRR